MNFLYEDYETMAKIVKDEGLSLVHYTSAPSTHNVIMQFKTYWVQ